MQTDIQVKGLVGHELLVLDFVLVAEFQRALALVLADELANYHYLAILVFLIENIEFAKFKRWLQANYLLLLSIKSLAFLF